MTRVPWPKKLARFRALVSDNWLVAATAAASVFCLLVWLLWGMPRVSAESVRWCLNAVVQSTAALLGLVVASFVFTTDRADRSVDYLSVREVAWQRRLRPVLPSVIQDLTNRIASGQLGDGDNNSKTELAGAPDALRSLVVVMIAAEQDYEPSGATARAISLPNTSEEGDIDLQDILVHLMTEGIIARSEPERFIEAMYEGSLCLAFDDRCPHKAVFNEFLDEYHRDLMSHVAVVGEAEWLRGSWGKTLVLTLGTGFLLGAFLLSAVGRELTSVMTWGSFGVLALTAASIVILAVIVSALFS